MTKKRMIKIKSKICVFILAALFVLLCLAGCSPTVKEEDYKDALFITQNDLVGYREYVSYNETSLTLTMSDSLYTKTFERFQKEKHISIVGAELFPKEMEEGILRAGGVYESQLEKIISKSSDIVVIELSGRQILNLAEQNVKSILAVNDGGSYDERYYHFAGVGFVYDTKKPVGDRIISNSMIYQDKLIPTENYTVALSSNLEKSIKFRNVVGVSQDYDFLGYTIIDNEFSSFVDYFKDKGVSALSPRMIDKAEIDAPRITMIVILSIVVVAVIALTVIYFNLKKKRKKNAKKTGGQPSIDV